MLEIWQPALGGVYQVSNLGRVRRRSPKGHFRLRVLRPNCHGYVILRASINNKYIYVKLHQLVASTFLGVKPEGLEINHKDGNKLNNCVDNLEYVTHKENMQHAAKAGLMPGPRGENSAANKLTKRQVTLIRKKYGTGEVSVAELSRKFGVTTSTICNIVKRKTWAWTEK